MYGLFQVRISNIFQKFKLDINPTENLNFEKFQKIFLDVVLFRVHGNVLFGSWPDVWWFGLSGNIIICS